MKIIPYGRQYIDRQDIRLVSKALKKDLITTGSYVKKFEAKISRFLKVKYTASCNSGTSALHLALMAINLKKDDVIIMPAINFIAAYNMARLMNAKIFLADVDTLTGQMTPETLLKCIKNNKLKKIKAIVTMYLGGYPENVIEFYNIKKKFNCYLIEDACHALGAKYLFRKNFYPIGSCKNSDISTFSLHPVKTITTGEGGLITTNNKLFYNRILSLRSHGINKDRNFHWKYDLSESGFNYRLSDANCALGLGQLKKINKFINYRKKIFNDVFILDNVMASNSINVKKNYKSLVHMDAHLPCKQNKNTADVIAFFCLEPFYKQNGSTRIWPKSHKTGIRIQNSKNYKHLIKRRSVVLEAKRGSCVFILGQTWHQIGKNEDSNSRWGIFTHYKRWWIKPSTDFTKCGLKIFNKLNNKQKELLGFNSISPRYDFKKQTKKIRTLRKISQIKNLSYKKTLDYYFIH